MLILEKAELLVVSVYDRVLMPGVYVCKMSCRNIQNTKPYRYKHPGCVFFHQKSIHALYCRCNISVAEHHLALDYVFGHYHEKRCCYSFSGYITNDHGEVVII